MTLEPPTDLASRPEPIGSPSVAPVGGAEALEFRLLGPLQVLVNGREVSVGTPQERALLALLASSPGRVLSVAEIVSGLWGEQAPPRAGKTVQVYVSKLRRALAATGVVGVVVTRAPGYLADVSPASVDAERFVELAASGRRLLGDGRTGQAAAVLREGIGLWRGEAFAEFDAPFAERERTRLGELRLASVEERVAADLALGGGPELVGELEDLVAEYPLRERLWQQLIIALYRAGRQAEALAAYQRVRSRLVEELGIEPGQGLRELERRVLAQDPTLFAAPIDTAGADLPDPLGAPQPTLVGRDAELAWLRDAYRQTRPADVVCRVVDGPSGIGKTRLAAALATSAYADGAAVEYLRGGEPPRDWTPRHWSFRRGQPTIIMYDDLHRATPSEIEQVGAMLRTASGALLVILLVDSGEMSQAQCAAVDRLAAEWITLGPLSEQSVAEIVRGYVDEADLPEALSAAMAAGGAPKDIHRIAYLWAERHALLLVDDAVVRLPDSRTVLAAGRDQLSNGVLHLRQLRQDRPEPLPDVRIPVCPYKGLAAFDSSDAAFFFGRERLVATLVTRLVGTQVLAVVGASGAGKSSVVRAGLLPALQSGTLPGSADWVTTVLTPTHGLPPPDGHQGRQVLVIDQFEEVFTALDDQDRGEYLDRLMRLVRPGSAVTCVLTLRADYYGHCAVRPELAELLADNTVLVGPMDADELRDAIERPAAAAGLSVDDGVSDTMLADLVDQPGALPLLSTALLGLWEQREGRRITLAGYLRAGGVREAISRLAESAYGRLTGEQRLVARRILLRLAAGAEGPDLVRRRAPVSEVAPADDDQARRVLNVLADRRLVTLASDTVEIAHEALLREWPRLRGWLDEDEVGRHLREHLSPAARDWAARDRDPAELYRGPRLVAALEWAEKRADGLTPTEREYLQASQIAADAEARQRRRSIRRLRVLTAGLAVVLALAVTTASLAAVQRNHANQAALAADVRTLRARAAIEQRWDRALLYAAQAQRMEPSADSRMALLSTLQRSPEAVGYLRGDSRILQVALNGDGTRLVTGDNHGEAIVWDSRTRHRLATLTAIPDGGTFSMDVSDDGRWLVAVTYTFPQPGLTGDNAKLYVTDLAAARPDPRHLDIDSVVAVAFTADPHLLLVRHQDGSLQLADTTTGTVRKDLAGPSVHGDCPGPYISMSPGRRYFTTGCRQTAEAWDLSTNRPIWAGPASDGPSAVDASSSTVIRTWQDGTVDKVDRATGRVTTATQGHQGAVSSVTWAPDGREFATTSADNTVILWDPRTMRPTATLRGHTGQVKTAAISPDGTRLYSAGLDSSVFIWDLDGRDRLSRPVPLANPGGGPTGQYDYDIHRTNRTGTLLVSLYTRPRAPTQNGVIEVDDLTPQDGPGSYVLESPEFSAADLDIDDAGQTAAILHKDPTNDGLTVRVLDLASRRFRPFTINLPGDMTSEAVAISADGRTVTAATTQSLRRWDALTGAEQPGPNHRMGAPVGFAQRSPDDHTLALIGPDTVELVDLLGKRRVAMIPVKGAEYPAFSPDGRLIAVASFTGELTLADTRTGLVQSRWLAAPGPIYSVAFTPDGHFIVAGAFDGKASFWSVEQPTTANAVIDIAHAQSPIGVVVLQDSIVTFHPGGPSLLWDINADNLLAHACAIAGRDLSPDEWTQIMPYRPYQRTCPDQA